MKRRGQLSGNLVQTVFTVIAVVLILVIGAVMFGQLRTINTNSLGNNTNATLQIDQGFALLSTAQGIIVLVIVIGLLALALYSFTGFGQGRK